MSKFQIDSFFRLNVIYQVKYYVKIIVELCEINVGMGTCSIAMKIIVELCEINVGRGTCSIAMKIIVELLYIYMSLYYVNFVFLFNRGISHTDIFVF